VISNQLLVRAWPDTCKNASKSDNEPDSGPRAQLVELHQTRVPVDSRD